MGFHMPRLYVSCIVVMGMITSIASAAEGPLTLNIWPSAAPGEKGDIGPEQTGDTRGNVQRLTNVSVPTISIYRPEKSRETGTAIIICPGGGYHILAMDLEGVEVARWANSVGVTAVVLKYRVPARKGQPRHLAPLQDAQRAIRLVRQRAGEWGIDPRRIGILGFSAGGHVAALASTNFDAPAYEPLDEIDKVDCRPDFTVLVYPAYLTAGEGLAPEVKVGPRTPPAFMAHAHDDRISAENSVAYYMALKRNGVPGELHIYSRGGHGFGLRPTTNPSCTWPERCEQWLRASGLLEKRSGAGT